VAWVAFSFLPEITGELFVYASVQIFYELLRRALCAVGDGAIEADVTKMLTA
jgi:hypothetical protein